MSDQPTDFNPYQPASGPEPLQADYTQSVKSTSELARWQTFFAVLMALGTLLMLGMFGFTLLSATADSFAEMGGMVFFAFVSLVIYGLPAIMLWKASVGARKYANSPGPNELAEFTAAQLSFWRTIGIIAAIVMGLYAMLIVGVMVFGLGMAFSDF